MIPATVAAVQQTAAGAHVARGSELAGQGKLDEAIREFREAIRLNPEYAEAHYDLGAALFELDNGVDEALAEFREALRINRAANDVQLSRRNVVPAQEMFTHHVAVDDDERRLLGEVLLALQKGEGPVGEVESV